MAESSVENSVDPRFFCYVCNQEIAAVSAVSTMIFALVLVAVFARYLAILWVVYYFTPFSPLF